MKNPDHAGKDGGRFKPKNTFKRVLSRTPVSIEDMETTEDILATWIMRAYVADHPELFGPESQEISESIGDDMSQQE